MSDNYGVCPIPYRLTKHISRVDRCSIDRSLRNVEWLTQRMVIRVHRQHEEMLLLWCAFNDAPKHLVCGRRNTEVVVAECVILKRIDPTRQLKRSGDLHELGIGQPLYRPPWIPFPVPVLLPASGTRPGWPVRKNIIPGLSPWLLSNLPFPLIVNKLAL